MPPFEVRSCRRESEHAPHYWGEADVGSTPLRCLGVERRFFYRDWEREVRRFHPPGPDQIQAARELLEALDQWEEMPDTAGSRWAIKFVRWLAQYTTPPPDKYKTSMPGEPDPTAVAVQGLGIVG